MKTFKQSTLLLIGVVLLAVMSCKKTDVAPTIPQSVSTTQNATATQTIKFHDDFDLTGIDIYDGCTGEIVDLSGIIYNVGSGVTNNNKTIFDFHQNSQGAKGIGETT